MTRRTLARFRGPAFIGAAGDRTWIAEPSPLGARLVWSVMPTRGPVGDELISPRRVPRAVRRAALAHFLGSR